MNTERVMSDLFISLSAVLIFVSLAFFIDMNGYSAYAPIILATGVLILLWPRPFLKALTPLGFISKPLLLTLSHIFIFIGAKVYLDQFIGGYWFIYLILGVILLNNNQAIANKLFKH